MSEDFATDPSFSVGESTPIVHEQTDDVALYRFVRSSRAVPSPDFGVSTTGESQRVFDARVGEEVTQLGLPKEEPLTQIEFPPPVFETDPEILEPTDPDSPPDLKARMVAGAKPRPKIRNKRRSILRPLLLYGLPGLALGMAVSTWVLLDRTEPNPTPAVAVIAVAKPGPKSVVVVQDNGAVDQPIVQWDEPTPPPRRVDKRRPSRPFLAGSATHRKNTSTSRRDQKLDRLISRARANVLDGDYVAAYVRLRGALPLLKDPKRKAVQRCLMRRAMELEVMGAHTARMAQCVRIAASSP